MIRYLYYKSNVKIASLSRRNSIKMVKARKYVVRSKFDGLPKKDNFEIVEYELPPINNGEILVKVEWVSVDPYLRVHHERNSLPYDQFGKQVAVVLESKDPRYPVGSRVIAHKGWTDYCILNTANNKEVSNADRIYKLPNLRGLSPSLGLGAVGMPGATAFFGLLELCEPKTSETVVISGAAGAVGHIVGQIAKLKGCRVIGLTGSLEKVDWLKKIGFDYAYNYKTANIADALKESAPKGVDIYFDNVGGEISSVIINHMREFGRVCACGSIVYYNDSSLPKATVIQPAINNNQVKIQGIATFKLFDRWPEAFSQMIAWISEGKLVPQEHITEGFESISDAFVGMLRGENCGKAVVKIG